MAIAYTPTASAYQPSPQQQNGGAIPFTPGQAPPPQAPAPQASGPYLGQGAAGEFGAGVVGSLMKTGSNIMGGLDQTLGRVGNAIASGGKNWSPTNTAAAPNALADKVINQSGFSQAGNVVGMVAPYFLGGGEGEGAVTAATEAPGLLAKAGSYALKALSAVARDTAIGTAQTGNLGQGLAIGATSGVLRGAGDLAKARVPTDIQKATDALNPDLTGKAKINAYKQVANGREAVSPNMLHDQSLSPSDRTKAVATRLMNETRLSDGTNVSGVKFTKDPVVNLKTVGKALNQTEQTLQAHPDMGLPLQKDTLVSKLDSLKEDKPMDFIGDSGKIYNNVVSYAQKLINQTGDTIGEGRAARTAFDQEAVRKFPTAFKNGVLDTSTPAGSAIKSVRDTINQHLYSTAPNGGDLQSLVGREADLFQARDISAAKAAKLHGSNWFKNFAKERPILTKALGYGALALGGGEIAKNLPH